MGLVLTILLVIAVILKVAYHLFKRRVAKLLEQDEDERAWLAQPSPGSLTPAQHEQWEKEIWRRVWGEKPRTEWSKNDPIVADDSWIIDAHEKSKRSKLLKSYIKSEHLRSSKNELFEQIESAADEYYRRTGESRRWIACVLAFDKAMEAAHDGRFAEGSDEYWECAVATLESNLSDWPERDRNWFRKQGLTIRCPV
jgi:hypothetical protein